MKGNVAVAELVSAVETVDKLYHAATYLSDKEVISVTRRRYHKKIKKGNMELILTIGKPNYRSRQAIKKIKKVGGTFPVRLTELRYVK